MPRPNRVDPEIGAKIYPWVFWKHKRYTGVEAAYALIGMGATLSTKFGRREPWFDLETA